MKALIGLAALGAVALSGCTTSQTAITAAICTDAVAAQSSGLALNKNQSLALTGILASCNATAGGTQISDTTVALAIIQNALIAQSSGLLSDVHIRAEVPEHQQVLRKIKAHWARLVADAR